MKLINDNVNYWHLQNCQNLSTWHLQKCQNVIDKKKIVENYLKIKNNLKRNQKNIIKIILTNNNIKVELKFEHKYELNILK